MKQNEALMGDMKQVQLLCNFNSKENYKLKETIKQLENHTEQLKLHEEEEQKAKRENDQLKYAVNFIAFTG
jgi:DNA repair ATPase RecN